MSALYPLRMNSKYQTEIELLEGMGFDADTAAQYLEENDGNVLNVIEQLFQQEVEHEEMDEPGGEQENQEIDLYTSLCDTWNDVTTTLNELKQVITLDAMMKVLVSVFGMIFLITMTIQICLTTTQNGITASVVHPVDAKAFNTVYDFEDDVLFRDDDVIIKHMIHYDAYLQLTSSFGDDVESNNEMKSNGGVWIVKRVYDDDRILVELVNKYSGKYLRINCDGVNAGGSSGRFTLFEATLIEAKNHGLKGIRLESVEYPHFYVVIRSDGSIGVTNDCDGDIDCVLIFMTKQRSMELINLKNELKIGELQQEIQDLKERFKEKERVKPLEWANMEL